MRGRTLVWTIAVAVALASCGVAHHGPGATTTGTVATSSSTSPSTTSPPAPRPQTPRVDVERFARAYGEYLDGQVPAGQLTDVSLAARRQLGPPIQRPLRSGLVTVASVRLASLGSRCEAFLRDGRHTLQVGVQVNRSGGHDVVVGVVPPDLDSILQKPSKPVAAPRGSAPAEQAARTFLTGYIPWVYGHGKAATIAAVAPQLHRELRGRSLPQSAQAPNLHPRVVAIGMQRAGTGWTAQVNISDSERTYDLNLTVVRVRGTWEVNRVQEPS